MIFVVTKLFVDINPVTNNSELVIPVAWSVPVLILVETKLFTVLLDAWSVPELILVETKLFTVLLDAWSVPVLILVETKLFVDIKPVINNAELVIPTLAFSDAVLILVSIKFNVVTFTAIKLPPT